MCERVGVIGRGGGRERENNIFFTSSARHVDFDKPSRKESPFPSPCMLS